MGLNNNKQQQQQQQSKRNKKRYRDNHQLRQLQARLHAQGFDVNSLMLLLNAVSSNKTISKQNTCKYMSMKQVSKKRRSNRNIDKPILKQKKLIIKLKDISIIKPNYLNMTDSVFKQMLLTTWKDNESMVQWLDTTENLNYVRQYTQLMNTIYCLKYEQDIWQTSYQISMLAGIWFTPITYEMASENNLSRYLFTTRENVEKRQKKLIDQLTKTQQDLNEYQQQQKIALTSVDMNLLVRLVTTLVGNELHQLRTDYEWKKVLFQYDANDYRLVKLFYDLNPMEDKIHSAKLIWQITTHQLKMEEQVVLLNQHINIEKQYVQLNHDRMTHAMMEAEDKIRNYKKVIDDEKTKLLLNGQSPLLARLMNAIQIRQKNMHERAEHLIQRQFINI